MSWLNPTRWLLYGGLLLALLVGYAAWERHIEAKGYERAQAEYTAAALKASEAARAKEQALTIANQGVDRAYQVEKTRRAAAERVAADRLRDLEAAIVERGTPEAISRINGTGGLERELLGNCAQTVQSLAIEADRLEGKVVGLQNYVNQVCVTP